MFFYGNMIMTVILVWYFENKRKEKVENGRKVTRNLIPNLYMVFSEVPTSNSNLAVEFPRGTSSEGKGSESYSRSPATCISIWQSEFPFASTSIRLRLQGFSTDDIMTSGHRQFMPWNSNDSRPSKIGISTTPIQNISW